MCLKNVPARLFRRRLDGQFVVDMYAKLTPSRLADVSKLDGRKPYFCFISVRDRRGWSDAVSTLMTLQFGRCEQRRQAKKRKQVLSVEE
jgi:hypothetical protein